MIQEILTWTTVIGAIIYTLYSFWKNLFASNPAGMCGGGCTHCQAKSLLVKDMSDSQKKKDNPPIATLPPNTFRLRKDFDRFVKR